MARSFDTDPLLVYNFALLEVPTPTPPFVVAFPIKTATSVLDGNLLSFQSISIPSMTLQTKKIQEGNWPFMHSVPISAVQTGQVKIRQAVTALNIDFFTWFSQAVSGTTLGSPRRNFVVIHTRQDKVVPRREIFLWDCIPVEWRPSTELNASANEIAIEELTLDCNRIDVLPGIGLS